MSLRTWWRTRTWRGYVNPKQKAMNDVKEFGYVRLSPAQAEIVKRLTEQATPVTIRRLPVTPDRLV